MDIPTYHDLIIILYPENIWHKSYGCGVVFFTTMTAAHFGLKVWYQKLTVGIIAVLTLNTWYLVYDYQLNVPDLWYFWILPVMSVLIGVFAFYLIPNWTVKPSECIVIPDPPKPPKNLLVVIANFEPISKENKKAKEYSETISFDLWTGLKQIKEKDSEVPMEDPKLLGEVIRDEEKAVEKGREMGAHLVVWGYVKYEEVAGNVDFYFKPIVTCVHPLGPNKIELEERQPKPPFSSRSLLTEPEVFEFRKRKIEETTDMVSFVHGLAVFKQQDYQGAINIFKGIKDPDAEVFFWHGTALMFSECLEDAIEQFDKAIKINPQHAVAWNNKGVLLSRLGKYEDAITYFDKALEINPKLADAWYNKGASLVKLGKDKEAITCLDKSIEINPQNDAWDYKGRALWGLGKIREGITCFEKARRRVTIQRFDKDLKILEDSNLEDLEDLLSKFGLSLPHDRNQQIE